jgi:hypothetical protein
MNVQTQCSQCGRFAPHTECPPPPETVTLPVTLAVVPKAAAELVVVPKGSMSTRDGQAFSAEVYEAPPVGKKRGQLLGMIEQDGHGGGTYFYPATPAARVLFSDLTDEYAAMGEDHHFASEEALCNDLYEEVALARDLNRKRNAVIRSRSLIRPAAFVGGDYDPGDNGIRVINAPLDDRLREWARSQYADAEVWIKSEGWQPA